MSKKALCPRCNTLNDVDDGEKTFICKDCGMELPTVQGVQYYNNYLIKLMNSANQYYNEAYSYEEAYRCYDEYLRRDPDSLDAALGKLSSEIRKSTLKNSYLKQFFNDFNSLELELEDNTYIRIGHFIETSYTSLFIFIKRLQELYVKEANDLKNVAVLYNLLWIKKIFKQLDENLKAFTDAEKNESFFLDAEEINYFEDQINGIIFEDKNVERDGEVFYLYTHSGKFNFDEISDETFAELDNYVIFVHNDSKKSLYIVFTILIAFVVIMIVGFALTLSGIMIPGYTLLGVGFGGFIITYVYYKQSRKKYLENINKY